MRASWRTTHSAASGLWRGQEVSTWWFPRCACSSPRQTLSASESPPSKKHSVTYWFSLLKLILFFCPIECDALLHIQYWMHCGAFFSAVLLYAVLPCGDFVIILSTFAVSFKKWLFACAVPQKWAVLWSHHEHLESTLHQHQESHFLAVLPERHRLHQLSHHHHGKITKNIKMKCCIHNKQSFCLLLFPLFHRAWCCV